MVGNSLRSDIEPVVRLGGWGVHVPYEVTWAHELEHGLGHDEDHYVTAAGPEAVPDALAQLESRVRCLTPVCLSHVAPRPSPVRIRTCQ